MTRRASQMRAGSGSRHDVSALPALRIHLSRAFASGVEHVLALAWASCGTVLPPGSRVCNKCGTLVTAERDAPARLMSPEAYTPMHLAEKILTSKAALEGERKQVTVLFADLKGSMELLADLRSRGRPQASRPLRRAHDGGRPPLRGHGEPGDGRRDHRRCFGAPLAHADHAVRACYCRAPYARGPSCRRGRPPGHRGCARAAGAR